jgi:hypothetical protein
MTSVTSCSVGIVLIPDIGSWVEVEELRRVWWGVIILDRWVTIQLILKVILHVSDCKSIDTLQLA